MCVFLYGLIFPTVCVAQSYSLRYNARTKSMLSLRRMLDGESANKRALCYLRQMGETYMIRLNTFDDDTDDDNGD